MSAAVLAGGESRRMEKDKAFLEVDGRRIIDRSLEILGGLFDHVFIVTNVPARYASLGIRLVGDLLPGCGALGGLFTALHFSPTEYLFVVACDMPLLNPDVIRLMVQKARSWDVVVGRIEGRLEPLHAVYSRRCLDPIARMLDRGERRLIDFYPQVRVLEVDEADLRRMDPDLRSFQNINTPEDLGRIHQEFFP